MRRLGAQNLAEEHPSKIVQWLFYSHPPIRERIAAAQTFKVDARPIPAMTRAPLAAATALIAFTVVALTVWPLRSRHLFSWDSANYAFAVERIDISAHRPHPPGYLGYGSPRVPSAVSPAMSTLRWSRGT